MRIQTRSFIPFLLATVLFAADQGLKLMAASSLRLLERVEILGQDLLVFSRVSNVGMAFGRQFGVSYENLHLLVRDVPTLILAALTLAVAIRWRGAGSAERLSAALVLGGGASNLFSQWSHSRVVDYLQVWIGGRDYLPFNIADLAILGGGFVLVRILLRDAMQEVPDVETAEALRA